MTIDAVLAPHVRACASGDWVVFLNLRADRYHALGVGALSPYAWRKLGVSVPDPARTGEQIAEIAPEDARALETLVSAGLATRVNVDRDRAHNNDLPWILRRLPDGLAWFWASSWAADIVSGRRLERAVARLTAWKANITQPLAQSKVLARFERLRPWYPRRRVCLFDALALMAFALSRGVSADWVTGVRGRPFAAHCWVETEGQIISVTDDDCTSFTPILRV